MPAEIGKNRVVITGVGVTSPYGAGFDSFLQGVKKGNSCAKPIVRFDTTGLRSKTACVVPDLRSDQLSARLTRLPRGTQYGVAAGEEALFDAGLDLSGEDREKIGVFFSSSCNTEQAEQYHAALVQKGPSFVSPLFFQNTTYMAGPGAMSIQRAFTGPAIGLPGGYSCGLHAIEVATCYLLRSYIDIALVIGADELGKLHFEALYNLRLLTPQCDNGEEICRPFDAKRDGMVLGEGAGAVVLESLSHASKRGARTYAELAGIATAHDAYRPADIAENGKGLEHAMRSALREAGLSPQSVCYIAGAANSSRLFDKPEVTAIKTVLGSHAHRVSVSSIKSMLGETFAAGGIFNVLACIIAIRDATLPPTINYENRDPECDLDCVPNTARQKVVDVALANGYSFGGSSASLVLRSFR